MQRYIVMRLFELVLVVLGVTTLVFFLLRLSGDPISLFVTDNMSREQIEAIREQLGFNDPLWLQYIHYMGNAVRGDFGVSLRIQQPALPLVLDRLPATLELTVMGLLMSMVIGVPMGVLAAVRRGSLIDKTAMAFSVLGQGMPVFWLGLLLILLFAAELRILPSGGMGTPAHFVLPAITLGLYSMARVARLTRSSMLDVLGQDYIRTAHSKGLAPRTVITGHALRAAAVSVVTVVGLSFSSLAGGAVITETIFSWPGIGRLLVQAVGYRDFPLVMASVFVIALFVSVINLITDLLYGYLDPRIRYD